MAKLTREKVDTALEFIVSRYDKVRFDLPFGNWCEVEFKNHTYNTVVALTFDEDGNVFTSGSSTPGGIGNLVSHTAALQRAVMLMAELNMVPIL